MSNMMYMDEGDPTCCLHMRAHVGLHSSWSSHAEDEVALRLNVTCCLHMRAHVGLHSSWTSHAKDEVALRLNWTGRKQAKRFPRSLPFASYIKISQNGLL
jgi:hypothetical protein